MANDRRMGRLAGAGIQQRFQTSGWPGEKKRAYLRRGPCVSYSLSHRSPLDWQFVIGNLQSKNLAHLLLCKLPIANYQ
jgi:hypothetical protein